MNRFWSRFVKPLIETVAPRRILEIGADAGDNTQRLLEHCRDFGAVLEIVDPAPQPALHEIMARFASSFVYHPLKSHDAIPRIAPVDLVLLDGDHNWFTVYNELQLLFGRARDGNVAPPIILFHDVAWPYARRDMYYDPLGIPAAERQPYAKSGLVPGRSELVEDGFNNNLANALHEGGPRNGVLTAIEDFRAGCDIATEFFRLPFYNGLGILVPALRATPALDAVIKSFFAGDLLLEICAALEADAMMARTQLSAYHFHLSQRTAMLKQTVGTIEALRAELKALKPEG